MYIEPKKRAAIAKLRIMYGTNEKKNTGKKSYGKHGKTESTQRS